MQRRDLFLDRVENSGIRRGRPECSTWGLFRRSSALSGQTPRKEDRQTLLFSATFTQDIINLAQQWTYDPITVEIEPERVATATVDQRVYLVSSSERLRVLFECSSFGQMLSQLSCLPIGAIRCARCTKSYVKQVFLVAFCQEKLHSNDAQRLSLISRRVKSRCW